MCLRMKLCGITVLFGAISLSLKCANCGKDSITEEEDNELTPSEFFDSDTLDSFFSSKTTKAPTLDEMAEYFFDVEEEESFFHKDKDLFEKMEDDEKFFFNKEKPKETPSKKCHCTALQCICCTGFKLANIKQYTGCLTMEYVRNDFCILITLSLNKKQLVTKVISGRNPVPFCTKSPIPFVRLCLRLYDLHHNPNGISMCMRLEAVSMGRILLSISFDCFKIENNKLSFMQPTTAMTFGFLRFHLGDTDPYISYQDWTKLHIPLPPVTITPVTTKKPKHFWLFK